MATLTTSWQKVAEQYIGNTGYLNVYIRCYAKYSSQNKENNTTTVNVESRIYSDGVGSWYATSGTTGYATISGNTSSQSANKTFYGGQETTVASRSQTITHNDDGTKTINVSSRFVSTPWGFDKTASASVTLPTINRLAMITSAADFNDEQNPTIEFTNPNNYTVYPYLNFYDDNNTLVYSLIRNTNTTSPYTWSISNQERTALRTACNQQQTYRVQIGVDTYNGATKLGYNSVAKVFSFINDTPTGTITLQEQNESVKSVLGNNSSSIVENLSVIKMSVQPTVYKEATVGKIMFSYDGGDTITTPPYEKTFNVASTNYFRARVYDSRGKSSAILESTKTLIPYESVIIKSFNFKRQSQTSSNLILNAVFTYYQSTFDQTPNVPTIQFKLDQDSTWTTIPSTSYTIDTQNHEITITNLTLSNIISYTQKDDIILKISDLLTSFENRQTITKGIPTFDAGEHDFKVNGTLYIADTDGSNKKQVYACPYDVGDILMTINSNDPADRWVGTTWQQVTDDVYLKVVTSNAGTNSGTSSEHKIPLTSMPAHKHNMFNPNASGETIPVEYTVTLGSGNKGYTRDLMTSSGGGQAYYPYYMGVYVWIRTS